MKIGIIPRGTDRHHGRNEAFYSIEDLRMPPKRDAEFYMAQSGKWTEPMMEPYPYHGDGRQKISHVVVISMTKAEATGAKFNQMRAISVQSRDKEPPECIKCVINLPTGQTTFGSLKKDDTTSLTERMDPSQISKESGEKLHARLMASSVHAETKRKRQAAMQARQEADAKEQAKADAAAVKLEATPVQQQQQQSDSSEEEPEEGDLTVEEVAEEEKGTSEHDPKSWHNLQELEKQLDEIYTPAVCQFCAAQFRRGMTYCPHASPLRSRETHSFRWTAQGLLQR